MKKSEIKERNKRIVAYYLSMHSLRQTGKEFGISAEMVRIILFHNKIPRRPAIRQRSV